MTISSKDVFEKYEVRKSRKQKTVFIEYVQKFAEDAGYSCIVEKGMLGVRNIVVGDVNNAKVVYTAHYDTCVGLPFPNFITPKNFLIYLLYQIVLVFVLYASLFMISVAAYFIAIAINFEPYVAYLVSYECFFWLLVALLVFIMVGPANKHNANDNTSGVTTLLDVMIEMPDELKDKVAFVFFDLEESGVIGSMMFSLKHKKEMKNRLLINFDCVSDGNNFLFAVKKKAKRYVPAIQNAFIDNERIKVEVLTKGYFYPSDQTNFPLGVGVASLKKSKHFNILYMDRIHTSKDTVYNEENIEFLKNGAVTLVKGL